MTEAVTVCIQVGHRLAFNFTVAFAYYSFFYVGYRGRKRTPSLAAARVVIHRSRGPPACSGRPSGPERRASPHRSDALRQVTALLRIFSGLPIAADSNVCDRPGRPVLERLGGAQVHPRELSHCGQHGAQPLLPVRVGLGARTLPASPHPNPHQPGTQPLLLESRRRTVDRVGVRAHAAVGYGRRTLRL